MKEKLLLALLTLSLVLTACQGGQGTPSSDPTPPAPDVEIGSEPTTLRFAVDDYERSLFDDLRQAFEKANPGLRVELVSFQEVLGLGSGDPWPAPEIAWQRLASAADVINIPALSEAVQQGLVRDLTPLIEADPTFQPEDFYPGTLASAQWDGGTWSLPTALTFQLIFFDQAAFDAAGVAYPEPGWTWDDFLAKARALTLREGDEVVRWGFAQPWPFHLPFIESRAGRLVDTSTDPPTPRFDRPEVIDAVRWYTNLYLKEGVAPVMGGETLIERGHVAMWAEFDGNRRAGVGVAPFPVDHAGSNTNLLALRGVSMSAGTAHPDAGVRQACWEWITFLSAQPDLPIFPARRSMAESKAYRQQAGAERIVAYQATLAGAQWPSAFYDDLAFDERWLYLVLPCFFQAYDQVMRGQADVEEALDAAQRTAEEYHACLVARDAFTDLREAAACRKEAESAAER